MVYIVHTTEQLPTYICLYYSILSATLHDDVFAIAALSKFV